MMYSNVLVTDFGTFVKNPSGYGHFRINFESISGKEYKIVTSDTRLLDRAFGAENPLKKDIVNLKNLVKNGTSTRI